MEKMPSPSKTRLVSPSASEDESSELQDEAQEILKLSEASEEESKPNFIVEESSKSKELTSTFGISKLTSDDEFYTFQCPSNFDLKSLLNKEIDCGEVTEIIDKTSGMKCNLNVLKSLGQATTCIFPNGKLSNILVVPIQGHIVFKRQIVTPVLNLKLSQHDKHNGDLGKIKKIKVRHPLLGNDYDDYIQSVQKRIHRARKIKKHKGKEQLQVETPSKKKKKKKNH